MKKTICRMWEAGWLVVLFFAGCCMFFGLMFGGAYFFPSNLEKSVLKAALCWAVSASGLAYMLWVGFKVTRESQKREGEE